MSLYPPQKVLRKDVKEYIRSCEYLLSIASVPNSPPFSREEHRLIEFYTDELAKLLLTRKGKESASDT